jgi:hypothetical protein
MSESVEPLFPEDAASPWELHYRASTEFNHWSDLIKQGGNLGFPWPRVHAMVGPLLPGWLVLVGARGKGGKSTVMRYLFDSWVTEFKKRILFVGTEQTAGILRALWATVRLRLPTEAALDPTHPAHGEVKEDVNVTQAINGLDEQAMIVAVPDITIDVFTRWARYAFSKECDVVMFDHFHRLSDTGASQNRGRNAAIRAIKNIASASNMLVVVAAQLKEGEGGNLLGQYEVPGPQSWAETAGLRRECDLAMQAWRPFVPGVTREQKSAARDDPAKLCGLVQPNVMAVRCDAHRYREVPPHLAARLVVNDGELTSWMPGHISDEPADA